MLELTGSGQVIAGISAGMALMSAMVRHIVLDKEKLKEQKAKLNECKAKLKDAQKKKDMKGIQKHQQDMMAASMEQMKHGMKPMIFTIIPFILVFGWLRGTYGVAGYLYNVSVTDSLPPGVEVKDVLLEDANYVRPQNAIEFKKEEMKPESKQSLLVEVELGGPPPVSIDHTPVEVEYAFPNGSRRHYTVGGGPHAGSQLKVEKSVATLQDNKLKYTIEYENTGSDDVANLFGFNLGWFGLYIITSIVVSTVFNKILGVM